jgi:hypothetical protein
LCQSNTGSNDRAEGAVVYQLGIEFAKNPIRNYGVLVNRPFRVQDPEDRRFTDVDGIDRCLGSVDWLYSKVMRNHGHVERTNDYCTFVKILELNASGSLQHSINFVVNDDDTPPEYNVTPRGIPFPVEAHISQTFFDFDCEPPRPSGQRIYQSSSTARCIS